MPRPPAVLGLQIGGSDPAACLLLGGELVASVRASRVAGAPGVGRSSAFPAGPVQHCLALAGSRPEDVEHVAFTLDRPETGRGLPATFALQLGLAENELSACFHRVEARRAALAGAFYSSPWEAAAVASIGGSCDLPPTVWGAGFDTALALGGELAAEHSPAHLTAALARHLAVGDEPEVLEELARRGQHAGGQPEHAPLRFEDRGRIEWADSANALTRSTNAIERWSDWLTDSFGPARSVGEQLEVRHFRAAATLLRLLESVVLHLVDHLAAETGLEHLCLTGGAASSPGLVSRIRKSTPFREVFVPHASEEFDAPGQPVLAVGAALDLWHRGLGFPRALPTDASVPAAGLTSNSARHGLALPVRAAG